MVDGVNRYAYAKDNPYRFADRNGKQSTEMPQEVRAAWNVAEKAGYDDASVERLIEVTEAQREKTGQSLLTRQSALEYATVRASAATANWRQGNYGRAVAHGALGVVESFGYAIFGDTPAKTARNAALTVALGVAYGRFVRWAYGTRPTAPSVPPPKPPTGSAPAPKPPVESAAPRTPPPVAQPKVPSSSSEVPSTGTAGNRAASVRGAANRKGPAPQSPLTASQQAMQESLLQEHPGLSTRVAAESTRGAQSVAGKGVKGADVRLLSGGGREVSVHTGQFTSESIGGHLVAEAAQQGTTEIYLQVNTPGATREGLLKMMPGIRNAYEGLQNVTVKIFGPQGQAWWTGTFGSPRH